jgi:transcription elongation factor
MLTDLQMDTASVVLIGPGDENNVKIQLPLADLEACFSVGDNVRVIAGDVSGRCGIVVKVDDASLTVIEDKTRVEVRPSLNGKGLLEN